MPSIKYLSISPNQTKLIAENLSNNLKGHEVIVLISDLGGGKTTFVSGLAKGLNSKDLVNSPSFNISHIYKGKYLTLYHYDFYRINDAGILKHDLYEILNEDKAVVVIEWAEIIKDILPKDYIKIKLKVLSETKRDIIINYPLSLEYLIT